jgi:hypothetical protein
MPQDWFAQNAPKQQGGDWFTQNAPKAEQPKPVIEGTLSANKQPEGWFQQAEHDLEQGGNRTILGRALGHLQGRGDKGYTGLESGVSKGAAETVGSPFTGALHLAEGYAKNKPLKVAQGALESGTLPGMFAAPEAGETAMRAIPTAKHAGEVLNQIEHAAAGVPVNLKNSGKAIMDALELDTKFGDNAPKPIKKLVARYTDPNQPPMSYEEARKFIERISALTAKEKIGATRNMKRQVSAVARALHQDIADAAAEVGESARYYASVKEYARAKRLASVANAMTRTLGKYGWKAALGGGALYEMREIAKGALKPANKLMPGSDDATRMPEPIQRVLETAKVTQGAPTSTYGGNRDIASVDVGDDKNIVVRDPSRMQPQVLGHEAKHLLDNSLDPKFRAQFPKDDPNNPYMKPEDLYKLPNMRAKGMTLKDLPEEHQAQIVQAYVAYGKDPKMRKMLEPWIKDMEKYPLSNIMPTAPGQAGINTTPRAPQVPYGALTQ